MRFTPRSLAAFGVAGTGILGSALVLGGGSPARRIVASPVAFAPVLAPVQSAARSIARFSASAFPPIQPGSLATSGPSLGPEIVVTSPVRGSFTTQGAALVQGSVSDATPITLLTINENPVAMGQNGTFSELVGLKPGLNTIDVVAVDSANLSNKVSLSVVYGKFQPAGQPIASGLALRLNQGSFDAVSKVIASKLNGTMLTNALIAKNPIAHWSSWIGSANVNVTSASFGNPSIALTPEPGDLRVHAEIPGVYVAFHEQGGGIVPSLSGHASCNTAVLDARIAVQVANGQVTTSVVNDSVDLRGFSWSINGLPDFITSLFDGLVKGKIQDEVGKMVKSTVPPEVNKMIAGATGQPITQSILGSEATFNLAPSSLSIDGDGLDAVVDADCSLAALPGYVPLPAPGSLVLGGAAPRHPGPGPDFFASVNQDLLNRAGFAVWQSGVAQIRIDDSPSSAFHMPPGYPLDMGLLLTFLPELQGTADPSDPLALCVTPLLPPVFEPTYRPDTLVANMGELQLSFVDTRTNQSVITFAVHVRAKATLLLNAGNTFDVHMSSRPDADASLVSSLAPNINTIGMDNVISMFLPTIVQMAGNQWSGFPLPTYPGLTPAKTSIYKDGSFVTAAGDFSPNGAPLPAGPSAISAISAITALAHPAPITQLFGTTGGSTGASKLSAPIWLAASRLAVSHVAARPGAGSSSLTIAKVSPILTTKATPVLPALPGETITATTRYVALVEDGLENAVAPLLAGYESRGVPVALVPLSHVTATGRDRAEEIRNWLVAHLNDGVKRYLLLVGGPSAIPFRTCQPSAAVSTVVTDLYYGDLRGDWDSNQNGVYGELDDRPGFDPQLYVGRLPFDDAASVSAAVSAIEKARTNKGAWSNRCLLVGATTISPGDDPIAADTAKALAFDPEGWETKTAFAPESFLKGDVVLGPDTIVNELSANPAGLLLTFSHGSTRGLMSHPDASTWNEVLTVSQLDQLPKDRPPVEVAVACNTADPTGGPCVGSIALQKGLAGWVGCTVVTDPRSGGGAWMLATMQLSKEIAQGTSLGEAVADTMRDYVRTGGTATVGSPDATADLDQQAMSWIVYGDPGLTLGPKAR